MCLSNVLSVKLIVKCEDKTKELMRVVECVYNKYMAILKEYGKE